LPARRTASSYSRLSRPVDWLGSIVWIQVIAEAQGWCGRVSFACDGVEDHDLLPDLARQSIGQVFDAVHGFEDHGIAQALDVKGGDFAEDGEQLAAVVQVARELEAA